MRLFFGLLTLVLGVVAAILVMVLALPGWWWWLIVAGLLLLGGFTVFEAKSGWCALRAMGIKTPI